VEGRKRGGQGKRVLEKSGVGKGPKGQGERGIGRWKREKERWAG